MRIPLLLAVTLSVLFMAVGAWIYQQQHGNIESQHLVQIFALAATIGTTFGFGVFPAGWFAFKFTFGSTLEESVYPGQSADWLVASVFLGTMCLALLSVWVFFGWIFGHRD